LLNFSITSHSLTFYGKCSKLANKGVCENHQQHTS
jgi:hypothetical protein